MKGDPVSLADQEVDPGDRLLEMLDGSAISQIVSAAALLEVPEHLAAGARTAEQLAAATHSHVEPLRRLMQAWCLFGLLEQDERPGHYRGTPALASLGGQSTRSLSGMARLYGQEYYWAWGDLLHTVRTGRSAFEHHHGTSLWGYLANHDQAAQAFAQAMSFNVKRDIPGILERYDFSGAKLVVDVGAANGELLAAILASYPDLRAIAFDLPRVSGRSGTVFEARGLVQRCEVMTGDFFESVPAGGDLYLLKAVLHNWDDERAIRILERCHAAMSPGSRLLIIENPGPEAETSSDPRTVMKDLWMMVLFGSGDRTISGYRKLARSAGFTEVEIVPGPGHPALIQATRR
jgi:hypothetical protein